MREYRVEWDGSNPELARLTIPVAHDGYQPQMGEHVIARDTTGRTWPARVGWDPRLGWVIVPQPADSGPDTGRQRRVSGLP